MLTTVLDTWPELFHHSKDDILFETIIWVIHNSGPAKSLAEMKVPEVKEKLTLLCYIRRPLMSADDLIKKIFSLAKTNFENPKFMFSLTKSLLLISRINDYQWTHNHIVNRLFQIPQETENGKKTYLDFQ